MKEKIEKITLNKEQSTKIFQKILDRWDSLKDGWKYSAPEVIEADTKKFLWGVYIAGRIDEKKDILTLYGDES